MPLPMVEKIALYHGGLVGAALKGVAAAHVGPALVRFDRVDGTQPLFGKENTGTLFRIVVIPGTVPRQGHVAKTGFEFRGSGYPDTASLVLEPLQNQVVPPQLLDVDFQKIGQTLHLPGQETPRVRAASRGTGVTGTGFHEGTPKLSRKNVQTQSARDGPPGAIVPLPEIPSGQQAHRDSTCWGGRCPPDPREPLGSTEPSSLRGDLPC